MTTKHPDTAAAMHAIEMRGQDMQDTPAQHDQLATMISDLSHTGELPMRLQNCAPNASAGSTRLCRQSGRRVRKPANRSDAVWQKMNTTTRPLVRLMQHPPSAHGCRNDRHTSERI